MISKYSLLKMVPNSVLYELGTQFPRYSELLDIVRLESVVRKIKDYSCIVKEEWPVCEITRGEFEYPLANICFVENVFKNIIWCIASKYRPLIRILSRDERINLWDCFFEQPFPADKADALHTSCPYRSAPLFFPTNPNKKDVEAFGRLYQAFFVPTKPVQEYFDKEYKSLIRGKRVLGVLCRGTDYISTKPKGHPVQPQIEDVITLVRRMINELKVDYLYLATEEERIKEVFDEFFPGRIIVNKRNYYDSYYNLYSEDTKTKISAVHFDRERDSFHKSLEYFSSLNLLSRCCGLIAGNCGGSRAALYLNGGKFEYYHLFDLGVY